MPKYTIQEAVLLAKIKDLLLSKKRIGKLAEDIVREVKIYEKENKDMLFCECWNTRSYDKDGKCSICKRRDRNN